MASAVDRSKWHGTETKNAAKSRKHVKRAASKKARREWLNDHEKNTIPNLSIKNMAWEY